MRVLLNYLSRIRGTLTYDRRRLLLVQKCPISTQIPERTRPSESFALWAHNENSGGCEYLRGWLVRGCRCEECFAEWRIAKFERIGRSTIRRPALEIVYCSVRSGRPSMSGVELRGWSLMRMQQTAIEITTCDCQDTWSVSWIAPHPAVRLGT